VGSGTLQAGIIKVIGDALTLLVEYQYCSKVKKLIIGYLSGDPMHGCN
jgi:hypothetical protein